MRLEVYLNARGERRFVGLLEERGGDSLFEYDQRHDRCAGRHELAPLGIDDGDLSRLGRHEPCVLQQGGDLLHRALGGIDERLCAFAVLYAGAVGRHAVLLVCSAFARECPFVNGFGFVPALGRNHAVAV